MKNPEPVRALNSGDKPESHKLLAGTAVYLALLVVLWWVARFFHLRALDEHPVSTFLAFATLFAPYWLFGFGLAPFLRRMLAGTVERIGMAILLALPYFVLTLPRGTFHWQVAAVLIAIPVMVTLLLQAWPRPANWADLVVLAT